MFSSYGWSSARRSSSKVERSWQWFDAFEQRRPLTRICGREAFGERFAAPSWTLTQTRL